MASVHDKLKRWGVKIGGNGCGESRQVAMAGKWDPKA